VSVGGTDPAGTLEPPALTALNWRALCAALRPALAGLALCALLHSVRWLAGSDAVGARLHCGETAWRRFQRLAGVGSAAMLGRCRCPCLKRAGPAVQCAQTERCGLWCSARVCGRARRDPCRPSALDRSGTHRQASAGGVLAGAAASALSTVCAPARKKPNPAPPSRQAR
jgi:hypothetical protein